MTTMISPKTTRGRVILNIVWLTTGTIFYWTSLPYATAHTFDPIGPHVFPQLMSLTILICAIGNLVVLFFSNKNKIIDQEKVRKEELEESVDVKILIKILFVFIACVTYMFIMPLAGYLISTVLLIFATIGIQGGIELKKNILISFGFALLLYLVFSKVLHILLPNGFLEVI